MSISLDQKKTKRSTVLTKEDELDDSKRTLTKQQLQFGLWSESKHDGTKQQPTSKQWSLQSYGRNASSQCGESIMCQNKKLTTLRTVMSRTDTILSRQQNTAHFGTNNYPSESFIISERKRLLNEMNQKLDKATQQKSIKYFSNQQKLNGDEQILIQISVIEELIREIRSNPNESSIKRVKRKTDPHQNYFRNNAIKSKLQQSMSIINQKQQQYLQKNKQLPSKSFRTMFQRIRQLLEAQMKTLKSGRRQLVDPSCESESKCKTKGKMSHSRSQMGLHFKNRSDRLGNQQKEKSSCFQKPMLRKNKDGRLMSKNRYE